MFFRSALLSFFALSASLSAEHADVVIYGGTPAGVMSAVAAARHGNSVALIDLNKHIGGVVSGGLTATDIGDRKTVGGLADEFFKRVLKHYTTTYGAESKQVKDCHEGLKFEPKVAEMIFEQMLAETKKVTIYRAHRYKAVTLDKTTVQELIVDDLATKTQKTFTGDVFIDASYEGDLLAGARVPYRIGREARAEFGEYLAGLSEGPKQLRGLGDHRTMAYNYRVCVTSDTANRVVFPMPEHYDPAPFAQTDGERARKGAIKGFGNLFTTTIGKAGPNEKYDANWCDFVGNSEGYIEGDWETRDRIAAKERDYFLSRLYYLQNDPGLPEAFRNEVRGWGLPKDEFTDNGNFPFQLYVRTGRRMLGAFIMSERDLTQDRWKADGVCSGSYGVDCHWIQWIWNGTGYETEQTQHVALHPYDIPYRSLTPIDHPNLLVPVCLASTHVAYCSTRMEPVFMMLGQAAGTAAHLAIASGRSDSAAPPEGRALAPASAAARPAAPSASKGDSPSPGLSRRLEDQPPYQRAVAVQKVDTAKLRELLRADGAILDAGYQPPVKIVWTPQHPKVGEVVHFTAKEGEVLHPITETWWDFDGNGTVDGGKRKADHAFELEKVYTVCTLVQDSEGFRRLVTAEVPVGLAIGKDVTVDDFEAERFGRWNGTRPDIVIKAGVRRPDIHFGPGVHRDVVRKGEKSPARIVFQPNLPRAGRYQLCLGFRAERGNATNVPLVIRCAEGVKKLTIDESKETTPFNFTPVGEFKFHTGESGSVQITNGGTDGAVVVDGVRWVWLGK